ncbi:unnamed protein product [Linum tenue]|uniref:BHLH domain-containing protein n=1 Tax=Linum tenue TaxID=586396 RepID=A0AAV0QNJ8_9ROSI|nr:unnamed protein product [Linum tenue]
MFPLFQGNELCFQISSSSSSPYPQDLILPTNTTPTPIPNPHHTYHAPAPRRRKKPASDPSVMENSISGGAAKDGGGQEQHEKKVMHREIERQRRQEMATLYASLRFLLPLHFIKGRRSMSDHMNEAVNYIKHLQRRIQDLDAHKNQLVIVKKKNATLTNNIGSSSATTASVTARPSGGHPTVEVRRCLGGLEIVLAEEGGGGSLRLSRVMRLLVEEGVSVVNCVSTVVNRKSFHTLLVEVEEPTSFDTRALQQKLMRINLILDH